MFSKKFLLPLLVVPLFFISSCGGQVQEPYRVIKASVDPITVNTNLKIEIDETKWKTEYKNNEQLSLEGLTVKNKDDLVLERKDNYTDEGYYFTTREDYPTNYVVKNLTITCSNESSTLVFYIALSDVSNEVTYVSTKIEVKVTNPDAIKPWVWAIITGAVAIIAVGMIVFTKKYKETHP